MSKIRLASLVKQQYPHLSSEAIEVKILSGEVFADTEKITDKNRLLKSTSLITLKTAQTYVSRGGDKLEHVLKIWNLTVKDQVWLDAGASTGGFSDCLLQHGARLVYAVDVGYNQLAYSLRSDKRIIVRERTNIKEMVPEDFPEKPWAAVCDLSFRSVSGVAGRLLSLTSSEMLVALIKPQFEYQNPPAEFRGVVQTDRELLMILQGVVSRLSAEGVYPERVEPSPIKGHKGNREFFFLLTKKQPAALPQLADMFED